MPDEQLAITRPSVELWSKQGLYHIVRQSGEAQEGRHGGCLLNTTVFVFCEQVQRKHENGRKCNVRFVFFPVSVIILTYVS